MVSSLWDVPSHLRLWLITGAGLTADLVTKHFAFTRLDPSPDSSAALVIIPQLMTFRRSLNTGALFGLGKGLVPVFVAASFLALGFVLYLFRHSTRDRRSLHVALGLILAGALGNLFDRTFMVADVVRYTVNGRQYTEAYKRLPELDTRDAIIVGTWPGGEHPRPILRQYQPREFRQGAVRDFIKMEPHFKIAGHSIDLWPWVFNIADSLLVAGVGLLMLNFWWERKAEQAIAFQSRNGGP